MGKPWDYLLRFVAINDAINAHDRDSDDMHGPDSVADSLLVFPDHFSASFTTDWHTKRSNYAS